MRDKIINQRALWNTGCAGGIALLLAASPGHAQSAKVAASSVQVTPDAAKKELAVGFRLVDDVSVTSVEASTSGKGESLPTTWEAWADDKAPACAWMIVVDTSNPARAKTVAVGLDFIRSFLTGLPKQDSVAVFSLARDLAEVAPFGSAPEDRAAALAGVEPVGDASLTTLIYANLREGFGLLAERKEPRKALLLLTDGKDETPGGAAAQEIERKKLIEAATKAGVVIYTVGYAESAADQIHFAPWKEVSAQTDGLFVPTSLTSKDVPSGTVPLLHGVMHGAGIARIDLSKLADPAAITVIAKTASGKAAVVQVPKEKVAGAIPTKAAEPAPGAADDKAAAAKKAEEDAAAAAKKAEEEAAAAATKAADDKKAAAAKKAADDKKRLWIIIGAALLLILVIAALLMVSAARKRAAEEEARLAEAARLAEEDRIAESDRRAAEATKKAEVAPLAWLEMCDAQQTRQPVRISSLKIGRGQHNDFVLRNDSVSGNHCVLNRTREGQWSVTDLNSGNGVVLNGERVQQAELRHGDTIELGELKMRFLLKA